MKFLALHKPHESAKKIAREELEKRKTGYNKIKIINFKFFKRSESLGKALGSARIPEVSVRPRKGQIKVDFIFALIFFTVMIFYIGIQVNNAMTSSLTDSKLDTAKSESDSILGVLVSTRGSPDNWETLQENHINRIGLATTPYNISMSKLNALKTNCNFMNKFGSINYRFSITSENIILLSCGYGGPRITSKSELPVFVNGKYGKAALEMW